VRGRTVGGTQFQAVGNYFHVPLGGQGGYGTLATGIASQGDIQAGLDGYTFYVSLFEAFMSNPTGSAYKFSLSNYSVAQWNEQNNPNSWGPPALNRDDKFDPAIPVPKPFPAVPPRPPAPRSGWHMGYGMGGYE
jgi:hypothetical protein